MSLLWLDLGLKVIIIIIMQRSTRHVSVIRMTNRRRLWFMVKVKVRLFMTELVSWLGFRWVKVQGWLGFGVRLVPGTG